MPSPRVPGFERLVLDLDDGTGDRLAAALHRPDEDDIDKPLLVLMHGLAGCETSSYMIMTAAAMRDAGYPVLRLNLRGAGPSRPICKGQYHAGRSADLAAAIRALAPVWGSRGIVMVGFSLAGNITLKFAAEFAGDLPVPAVISVSAPIDLELTAHNMLRPRNYLYNQKLLMDYKRQALADGAEVSDEERAAVRRSRNFTDVDNWFVAPRNNFRDAEDYWRKSMAKQFLPDIPVPALILHAADDPMVPAEPYLDIEWSSHANLTSLVTPHGGHLGFHDVDGLWYIAAMKDYLARL